MFILPDGIDDTRYEVHNQTQFVLYNVFICGWIFSTCIMAHLALDQMYNAGQEWEFRQIFKQ